MPICIRHTQDCLPAQFLSGSALLATQALF
jgi:hypothetical protein